APEGWRRVFRRLRTATRGLLAPLTPRPLFLRKKRRKKTFIDAALFQQMAYPKVESQTHQKSADTKYKTEQINEKEEKGSRPLAVFKNMW
ncbi:MAG: hypothetical protein ACI4JQ_02940, partial [Ruminococcus sp.]